jgi:multidrug efflux pump subunit AcrB
MNRLGFSGRIASHFIDSKLTPLIIAAAVLLGLFAVIATPREEEPQIIVPMVDVFVQMPGASAKEVEKRVTTPMEKLLWEIPGVEYIYSTSSPGSSMCIVRFYVGQDIEASIEKLYNKLYGNFDRIPPGAGQPLIKPRSIDDVPILALTFHGDGYDGYQLRQLVARLDEEVKTVKDVSETTIIGGLRRQVRVTLDASRLAAYGLSAGAVQQALAGANRRSPAGEFPSGNRSFLLETGEFLASPEDVGRVVVGVAGGKPIFLDEVAEIRDGPEEPASYVTIAFGKHGPHGRTSPDPSFARSGKGTSHPNHIPAGEGAGRGTSLSQAGERPAVTLSIAKRKGKNAIHVAEAVMAKVDSLKGTMIPAGVTYTVTRNYGETANEKSNELLLHMLIAIISVTLLIAFALGKRESLVVAIAVPVTLALTILVFYLYGYTLNRITLFALIFSIGILVDDAIVVVENIVRHFRMPSNHDRNLMHVAAEAVDEVGNPTVLATFAVIAAILPLAFVGGLMGPYMRPIPIGASAAMVFSLFIAFIISPWASYRFLKREACEYDHERDHCKVEEGWATRTYRGIMTPLIAHRGKRLRFLAVVGGLLMAAVLMLPLKLVVVKMLPFDNKSEFQVVIDMPEGTTLEQTAAATKAMARYLRTVPEVTDVVSYVGVAGPYNFNGLVRHYFLRRGPNVADIQVNLVGKHDRKRQSHAVAKAVRPSIRRIAARYGANVKVAEVPPGPPVLQTLVAEVYGPDDKTRWDVAERVKAVFEKTEGVTDVDWYVEDYQPKYQLVPDKEKAALNGITTEQLTQTIGLAVSGAGSELAHIPTASEDVPIYLQLAWSQRSSLSEILNIQLQGAGGNLVPLSELVRVRDTALDRSIYHKNLKPVVYVTGDMAGTRESPVYAILQMNRAIGEMKTPLGYEVKRFTTAAPFDTSKAAIKWDGEWHITYEVFRDMGMAFAAVLVLIYILVVAWFRSFKTPLVIMAPIPLTLVGILPAHGLLGAFFTATSMIGFIAGAGIIVRNSIILVDFIELRRRQGMALEEAVVDAGAVRFRPMLLTAAAVLVGASVILFDPIFQGLAISLMAGEVASTLISRMAIPVLYYMSESGKL